jgi:hypothetical protein
MKEINEKMWQALINNNVFDFIFALEQGADINAPPPKDIANYLMVDNILFSVCYSCPEIMQIILDSFNILHPDLSKRLVWKEFNLNILGFAILENETKIALKLLQLDPKLAETADIEFGWDAFMLALRKHNKILVNHFLNNVSKYNINFNKRDKNNLTPLIIAILNGNTPEDVHKIILGSSKSTINTIFVKKYKGSSYEEPLTALHLAIEREYYSLVKPLIESGAKVDLDLIRWVKQRNKGHVYDYLKQEYDKTKIRR